MTARPFYLPFQAAVKPTNVGAPSAKYYYYAAGTTTLQHIYTNSSMAVQLSNPLTANGAGQIPPVWLDDTLTWKVVIKDKLGATLWTRDNYVPGSAPDAADLAPYQAAAESAASASAASAVTAASGGTTATAQALIATGAATTATTQAGIATAAATTSTTQAGISTLAAASASSSYNAIAAAIAPGALNNATLNAATRSILKGLNTALGLPAYHDGSNWEIVAYSGVSALVTGDTAEGIYARSTFDSSKVWVRKYNVAVRLDWFGTARGFSAGANASANNAAWAALFSALSAIAPSTGGAKVLPPIDLGSGALEYSQTPVPPGTIKIDGRGMGMSALTGNDGGTLLVPIGCTGIRLDYNRSSMSNVVILGDYTLGNEAEYHGVHWRQTTFLTNIRCQSMRGDGYFAESNTGLGYLPDLSRLEGCEARNCRNGRNFSGSDANVIQDIGGTSHNNRQWGELDNSSLGIAAVGVEFSGNGTSDNDGVNIPASVVSYSGNLYSCIAGQETGAATNAPSGTTADNTYWYYIRAGGAITGMPAWFSGMLVRAGGNVRTVQPTARTKYTACYSETDQGKAQIGQCAIIDGGMLAEWVWHNPAANSSGAVLRASSGRLNIGPAAQVISGSVTVYIGNSQGNPTNYIWAGLNTTYGSNPYIMNFTGNNIRFAYNGASASTFFEATGQNTTDQFGTGAAFPNAFWVPNLMLSDNSKSIANGRRIMVDAAAPASGAHARGEVVFNRNAAVGSPIGWQCTVAGTPGTWVAMANL